MSNKFFVTILLFISLCVRCIYGYYSHYTEDEARMWQLGYEFILQKKWINHGMPIVYSNSLLPGSFQSIVASIPLWLNPSPFALIVFIQALNLLSSVLLYSWIVALFPRFQNRMVFCFFIFSPWSIMFSYAWNPSYMPFFSIIFILGLTKVFQHTQIQWGLFWALFPLFLMMQLNFQALALICLLLCLICLRLVPLPSLPTLFASQIVSALTLLPWFMYKLGYATLSEPTWKKFVAPVEGNLQLNLQNILTAPHIFLHLVSFASGHTVNRFEHGFLQNHPVLLPFVIVGEVLSFLIIIFGASFYFSAKRWRILGRVLAFKNKKTLSVYDKFDIVCLLIPIIYTVLVLFSVTTFGVHSFLCVFFLSYYILFRRLNELDLFSVFNHKKFWSFYISLTVAYSIIGGASFRLTYDMVIEFIPYYCWGPGIETGADHLQIPMSKGLFCDIKHATKIFCPYQHVEKNNAL